MQIAVVTSSYPVTNDDPAGHFVRAETRALIEAGHEVTLLLPRAASARSEPGITLHELRHGGLFGWPGCLARLRQRPWRLIGLIPFAIGARRGIRALGPFDRVVAHWILPGFWPICRDFVGETIVVAHGSDVGLLERLPRPLQRRIVLALGRDHVQLRCVSVELSQRMQRLAHEFDLTLSVVVEPARLDFPSLAAPHEMRRQLGFEATPTVVVVGRAVRSKRIDVAVEAIAGAIESAQLATKPQIIVIGDGPERKAWMRRFPEVRWLGQLGRHDALRHIRAADLLVSASLEEGAPTAIREARHLGTRVVAANAGDLASWAVRDTGLCIVEEFSSEPRGAACRMISQGLQQAARTRDVNPRDELAF